MLKRIKKLFSLNPAGRSGPLHISAQQHGVNKHHVSSNALKVIKLLQDEGWQAYLVGGGVRDLLLGGHPKDFDVATDATPEQVQRVFHRARIIGRRFKIVHVRMGREVLEVTTFRGSHTATHSRQQSVQNDKGILLRDNVYGNLESDAFRRDFSINALYYDPSTEEIIDYTNGMQDLTAKNLSIIGDPDARYKEDPVRMLRAIRFQCRLGFTISEETEKPIREHSEYLQEIPPARLFEEVLKLFLCGHATAILHSLHNYHLLSHLFPAAADVLENGAQQEKDLLFCAVENTDKRIAERKRITPAFIYAAFLWPSLQKEMHNLAEVSKMSVQERLFKAADAVLIAQQQRTAIPKRFQIPMREIWSLQLRLEKRDPKRALSLLEHARFRAAYDFVLLREQSGEQLNGLGEWWTKFQHGDSDAQQAMLSKLKSPSTRKRKRRSPRKPKAD